MRRSRWLVASWLVTLACGAGEPAPGGGAGGSAGSAPCSEGDLSPDARCIAAVSGTAALGDGSPAAAALVSVCGPVCFYGETSDAGAFDVPVGVRLRPALYSVFVHGRPAHTNFYRRLPLDAEGAVDVGELLLLELPAAGPALVVKSDKLGTPAQTVVSSGVTLEVPEGVFVKIDVEDITLGEPGKQFRALRVPMSAQGAFADTALGLELLVAFAPFEAAFQDEGGAPAKVRLSIVSSELAAGTKVQWLALGSYLFPDWVEPATFDVVATGAVSADGARIEMDPGEGIEYLTWVGVRVAP
ncbi:MAG: hypothetical protein KF718_17925 [Polyangiaceae bacterium]|nr:hypothetical protein [Polyangiaceae bacterium]